MNQYRKTHPAVAAALDEKKAMKAQAKADKRAHIAKLVGEGLPKEIIQQRAECSWEAVEKVRKELGARLPSLAQWSGG